ncbi:molybdate ABC transporter substrate-binding protein [Candidatus Poribacteria bacterium]|nr:MAG: molybdate ABC transporter substrate-binding protein [Candidatus Poribacteria bacterium]
MRFGIAVFLFMVLSTWGCGGEEKVLKLYCGGGLRPPVSEIIKLFEEETGIRVKPTYAGAGVLLTQIQLTRQGDLYMPGDELFIKRAEEKGLIAERRVVAYFIPVILVRKGNPRGIEGLEDLARPGVKVGMGDPDACAIGGVALDILEKNGLREAVRKNVVYTSSTVIELANAVKLGMIDAAIVWNATAALYKGEAEAVEIPWERNVIARIPIGILSFSKHKKEARKFLEFITSRRAKEVFRKHGYTTEL